MKSLKTDMSFIWKGLCEIHSIKSGLLGLIIFRAVFEAVTPFVNIYMSALIIDGIALGKDVKTLLIYAGITVSLNLMIMLLISLINHFVNLQQFVFDSRYEMKLSQKIISMDYPSVEDPSTHRNREKINEFRNLNGGGIWRLFDSFRWIVKSLFSIIFSISLTVSLFSATGSVKSDGILSFAGSSLFSIIFAVAIIANVFISMYSNATVTKKMYAIMNDIIPFNRIFGYYLESYITTYHAGKDIRIYNQKGLIEEESMSLFDDVYITLNKLSNNQMKYSSLITVSTVVLSTLIYIYIGLKALAGFFGVGFIVQYVGSINEFTNAFTQFMTQFTMLRTNNEALQVYFNYMDIPARMYQGRLPIEKRFFCDDGKNDYEIEFRNVSFKYPSSDSYALRNVSFKFKIGERLAIVGMNGSGKTTFIKLLCRLYDPNEGEILLNGTDIKQYSYDEYMSLFSVVFQDFKLFSFSLGQNVAAGVNYDKSKVEECLKEAGFGDRLTELPDGVETCLYKDFDEKGVEISGGEAQKIALARTLYKAAPFIILDEPTAALDPISEYEIYSKFNEIVGDKTVIYISHRLSSCRFCDDIAVFHKGQIVQQGSHNQLVSNENGQYYELWNAQAQYYLDEKK